MIWPAILGSAAATYLVRSLPFVIGFRGHLPGAASRYLEALPVAIIAALVGPGSSPRPARSRAAPSPSPRRSLSRWLLGGEACSQA